MRVLLLLMALLATAWAAPGVTLEQRLEVDREPLPFGKRAELVVEVAFPEDGAFQPPEPAALELAGATVLDRFTVDRGSDGTTRRLEYHIVFTRLEPGTYEVGPVSLGRGLETEPLSLEFSGATPKDNDKPGEIRGAKPVVELSTADFWKEVGRWTLALVLACAILSFLLSRLGVLDRLLTPRARALRKLKRLSRLERQPEDVLLYCVETLRTYLVEAYGLQAKESTSREILRRMTMDNRCTALKPVAEKLFGAGDRVKFAAQGLTRPEANDHFENLCSALKQERKVVR